MKISRRLNTTKYSGLLSVRLCIHRCFCCSGRMQDLSHSRLRHAIRRNIIHSVRSHLHVPLLIPRPTKKLAHLGASLSAVPPYLPILKRMDHLLLGVVAPGALFHTLDSNNGALPSTPTRPRQVVGPSGGGSQIHSALAQTPASSSPGSLGLAKDLLVLFAAF